MNATAKHKQRNRRSTILSRVTAAVVCVLLIVFFYFSASSRTLINDQVQSIKDGPYPISVAAGRVETLLIRLKTITAYPEALFASQTAKSLQKDFAEVNLDMHEKIETIATLDPDNPDAQNLLRHYHRLMVYQAHLIALLTQPDMSADKVTQFIDSRINPQIDLLLKDDLNILHDSTQAVDDVYDTVNEAIHANILVSYIFMGAVAVSIVVYLFILNRKSHYEAALREQLEIAVDEARSANEAKTAFLANMSHDIRTPMNAIIGLTEITRAHLDEPARVDEYLNRITISSEHLLGLINDVLDMSKIESGIVELNETSFSLPNMLSSLYTIVEPQRRAKHLTVVMNIRGIAHETLIGDTMRINQVLLNITGNAIKYTPDGGRIDILVEEVPLDVLYEHRDSMMAAEHSAIETQPEEQPALRWFDRNDYTTLRITVTDNGIGMSEEFLTRIFNTFERERNETTNFTQGTGLGMAITKHVLDIMGGAITVKSVLNEGSTFQVVLPVKIDKKATLPALNDQTDESPVRILLADDDEATRENALAEAESLGIELVAVASGEEAITAAQEATDRGCSFDAYIFDWVMTGIDGMETARHIFEAQGEGEIVYLATFNPGNVESQARRTGLTDFITKPLFASRLQSVADRVRGQESTTEEDDSEATAHKLEGRVLLVEDNEINCEIATELISSFGPTVEVAYNGQEAVERVKSVEAGYYQLIFMDWQMPRMNGIDATHAILEYEQETGIEHTPIVAMTANAFNDDRNRALAAGMDGFLAKPINLTELKQNLEKYLG